MRRSRAPLALLALLGGCLERTTGEPRPLDPRFTAAAPGEDGRPEAVAHQEVPHGEGEAGEVAHGEVAHEEVPHDEGAGPPGPFDGHEGPTIQLSGQLVAEAPGRVQLDLRAPDPEAEGGQRALGVLFVEGPGPFSLAVPRGFGPLRIEAFQDPGGDGPSDGDPFGALALEVGAAPVEGLTLALAEGGRLAYIAAQGGGADPMRPFQDHAGPWTELRGTISGGGEGVVALDLRGPDPGSPTGDRYLGKLRLPGTGPYTLRVPRGAGLLTVEAFQDARSDGPDARDPYARARVEVGEVEAITLDFVLVEGTWSPAPAGAAAGAPPGGGLGEGAAPLFANLGPDPVTVGGRISLAEGVEGGMVDLDVFSADPSAPGGRRFLGKLKLSPGPFSFQAPRGAGPLELEAFIDLAGDGPTPGDPFGRPAREVVVGQVAITDLDIRVAPPP